MSKICSTTDSSTQWGFCHSNEPTSSMTPFLATLMNRSLASKASSISNSKIRYLRPFDTKQSLSHIFLWGRSYPLFVDKTIRPCKIRLMTQPKHAYKQNIHIYSRNIEKNYPEILKDITYISRNRPTIYIYTGKINISQSYPSWWFQQSWKIWVKLGIFSPNSGENKTIFETTT